MSIFVDQQDQILSLRDNTKIRKPWKLGVYAPEDAKMYGINFAIKYMKSLLILLKIFLKISHFAIVGTQSNACKIIGGGCD